MLGGRARGKQSGVIDLKVASREGHLHHRTFALSGRSTGEQEKPHGFQVSFATFTGSPGFVILVTSSLSSLDLVTLAKQILPPLLTQNVYSGSKFKSRGTLRRRGKHRVLGLQHSLLWNRVPSKLCPRAKFPKILHT